MNIFNKIFNKPKPSDPVVLRFIRTKTIRKSRNPIYKLQYMVPGKRSWTCVKDVRCYYDEYLDYEDYFVKNIEFTFNDEASIYCTLDEYKRVFKTYQDILDFGRKDTCDTKDKNFKDIYQ